MKITVIYKIEYQEKGQSTWKPTYVVSDESSLELSKRALKDLRDNKYELNNNGKKKYHLIKQEIIVKTTVIG
jgi:hypothetical protein